MRIIKGDIFDYTAAADAICVTTNGVITKDGRLVMGKGIALEFAKRYPKLPAAFGRQVSVHGNRPCRVICNGINIVSFPTKNDWRDKSDIRLIRDSAGELARMADKFYWRIVVLPRPGCGLGQLNWPDVEHAIEPVLDNRFYIISK